jgi:hypothetical protein
LLGQPALRSKAKETCPLSLCCYDTSVTPCLSSINKVSNLTSFFSNSAGKYNFDDVARVAAIASMCVQPEVSHRPFMVEVVQALKVVHHDADRSTNGSDASDIIIYDIDGRAVRRKASQVREKDLGLVLFWGPFMQFLII